MSKSKCGALLCCAGLAMAQFQPIFRVGTRLVKVDAVVRNDKGAVRGLTQEDFIIQDNGKNQSIAAFSVTDAVGVPGVKPEPPADNVASNRINGLGEGTPTATVILFDRLNIPNSLNQGVVRTKVLAMLASLRTTDRVGFYSLGTALSIVQDFNEDADRLIQSARRLDSARRVAASDARGQQVDAALEDALAPLPEQESRVRTPTTQRALQTIARHLAGIPGRKNLIWVLSDFPRSGPSADEAVNRSANTGKVVDILSSVNVAIYPMDPRGMTTSSIALTGTVRDMAGNPAAVSMPPVANRSAGIACGAAVQLGQAEGETFATIGRSTGGASYHNSENTVSDVRRIMDEAEVTYTLGFYVDDKALDGKRHDLTVKLIKKPETNGATVRYKKNYFATPPQAAKQQHPALAELIQDPLDATAVGIMAATAPDPAKPGTHSVQVRVSLTDIQFEHRAERWAAAIDLGLAIEGTNGKASSGVTVPVSLSLTDDQLKQGFGSGLVIDSAAPTPAQPSRLRVVVQDKTSGAAGSVRIPIFPR